MEHEGFRAHQPTMCWQHILCILCIKNNFWKELFISDSVWTGISVLQQQSGVFCSIIEHKGKRWQKKSFYKHNSCIILKHYFTSERKLWEKIGHNWIVFVAVAFGCTFMHASSWTGMDKGPAGKWKWPETSRHPQREICVCVTQRERRRLKGWFKRLSHPLIMLLYWVGSFNLKQKREVVGIRDEEDDTCWQKG